MPDENEINLQTTAEDEDFNLFPPRRVYVINAPLQVEDNSNSVRRVMVENVPLLVEESNTTPRNVVIENTPLPVVVESGSVSLTGTPTLEVKMARQNWEYKHSVINDHLDKSLRDVSGAGFDGGGWELVCIWRESYMIFKRPI